MCAERSMISPKLRGKSAMLHYPRNFEPSVLLEQVLQSMRRTRTLFELFAQGIDFKPNNFFEYVLKCRAEFCNQAY